MRKQLRSFLKMMCFTACVFIGAQLTSIDPFSVVIPCLEVSIILAVMFGLAFLLVRE